MTFQSMLAQMSGSGNAAPADPSSSTPPTPPPPTVSANGADLPPQTATAGPMPPAAENASFQQMLSQMSGQPADGNTPPDPNAAPAKGGFVQGLGEGSGLGGVKQAVVGAAQDNKAQGERALDIYHQMIAAHAKGDSKTAAELAGNLSMLVTRQGLQKAYAPLLEAAKMVILDPVKAVQEQRAADKNATPSGKELDAQEAQLKSVWNRVKQDWESKNPDRADQVLTDVLHGTVGQPAMNAIPLVGPMISSMANNLDEASHAPGGEDRGRVLGNAIGAGGMALAGEAAGALGDFLPGAKGSVKAGLAEGQAGADAAQSVADTAHAHDTILQANKDKFQQQLDASVDKAQKAKEAQTQVKNDNKVEAGNQTKERTDAHNDLVTSARDAQHEHIDQTLDNATDQYGQQFKQSLHSAVISGVDSEDMATRVNKGINQYEGRAHADFENGMSGGSPRNPTSDSVLGQLQGKTVPAKGSPFQEMAAEKLKKPDPEDHAYTGDAADLAHANIDPKLEAKLQDWSEGIQTVEGKGPADTAGKPTTVDLKKGVGDFTAPQLVKIRQYLRKAAEGYPRGDVNRGIVMDMLKATDDTMGKLAEKNPEALTQYQGLRSDYKTARANLDSATAEKLRLNEPDQAMGDVNKYLLQGNNAAAKIKTMSSILGDETMGGLRQSYLNQLAEMAPADATKALRKIPADVRQEFFGAELDGRLTAASDVYEKSVANAKQAAKAQKDYASTAADEAVSRNGVQATFDRQAATAEAQQETVRIANDYKTAADNAKATFNTQNAPYSTDFSKAISNGTVGDQLGKGQIATADVNALRAALDPADYDKIKQGVINQQMQASTTAGHFNPVKFMDWYDNIPEPTRNAFFPDSTGTMPINVPAIQDAAKMQRLARAGIIAPVAAGGATLVTVLPHTAFAVLLETAAATGATYFGKEWAANLLDRLATSPRLLNTMAKVAPTVKAAAGATRVATRAATLAGPVLGPSFGRQVTVDGQPGTQVGIHPDSGKPVIMYHPQGAQ